MSRLNFILGETGTGKSRSLLNVDENSSYLINCVSKDLPFRKWTDKFNPEKKNYYETTSPMEIVQILKGISEKRPEIKNIFIDDYQYVLSFEYLSNIEEDVWDTFRSIGGHAFQVLNTARTLRKDLNVFILSHSETMIDEGVQKTRIKLTGKMVHEKITPEGLATMVLYTKVVPNAAEGGSNYFFITQNDGTTTAKSPEGMFDDIRIENDLQKVIEAIDNYY